MNLAFRILFLFSITVLCCNIGIAGGLKSIYISDFEVLDDTRQYNTPEVNAAQDKRAQMIGDNLRQLLEEKHLYRVVGAQAASKLIGDMRARQSLYLCDPCAQEIGQALHTNRVALCWVQKVSNLILNINIKVFDSDTDKVVYQESVDIRGNTDVSWSRGIKALVSSIEEKKLYLK
ncbi:MAG TPA: DUF3280 domain-containing protein [Burkholderiales bacterium]|nr:DUF3280 domain-containing protein [Burkholderiales bacterium]